MSDNNAGSFRECWMFDTHKAVYHLDDKNNIVGIQCSQIRNEVIGTETGNRTNGFIGNPGVFALRNSKHHEIGDIFQKLTKTYSNRIEKWLDANNTNQEKVA